MPAKKSTPLIAVTLLIALGACTYRPYQLPPKDGNRPIERSSPNKEKDSKSSLPGDSTSVPSTTEQVCPDVEITRLILADEFVQAKQLLNEDLDRSKNDLHRSCVLTSMGLLAALPESDYFDVERAQDFQSLARVNGVVQQGSAQLQLLDRTLAGLIALQLKTTTSDDEIERLQKELEKKEGALKKLKKLTLGSQ
ncbi:MAG: hypothetical protein AB8B48_19270 [Pseudomonadales bacterium]